MTEPFSHEARVQAGESMMDLFDALEDTELQEAMTTAKGAIAQAADIMRDRHGFDNRMAMLALVGLVLHPVMPDD